jgi:predicted amidophosphoribosyltransferase
LLRAFLKEGDAHFMLRYASRVHQQAEESPPLAGFFHAHDLLVPVPGSAPKPARHIWVAADLADALVGQGLGSAAWAGLRRIHAVCKSATALPGARPTVARHYESFLIERSQLAPRSVVLIDDVITKGRTLLAAASRVQEAFPNAQIRAFALLRTMGLVSGVQRLLDPCKGEIRWRAGDAYRSP